MKLWNPITNRTTHRNVPIACVAAVAVSLTVVLPQLACADHGTLPEVPANIEVPAGSRAFLVGRGIGTQNYICLPSGAGFAWTLFTPQATLFSDESRQLTTHFFSPNPLEGGTVRATWQHSRDTSTVWARAIASSSDPDFVAPGAIPWLLLQVVGTQAGPTGGGALTATSIMQRVNTVGGVAPATGCAQASDVGQQRFVPYEADYIFYTNSCQ